MKTLRYIGMAIMAIVLCIGFTACSSDDDDENQTTESLIGSTWAGTSTATGYGIEVRIIDSEKCSITVYAPNSSNATDTETCYYVYNEEDGTFACYYDGDSITGKISGNTMTLTDQYGTYKLKKK